MKIVNDKISIKELEKTAKLMFGDFVKAVVDIEEGIMIVDAELHADQELKLLSMGKKQNNLWGINLYPDFYGKNDFVEFDSLINIRPALNNRSRFIHDEKIRQKILEIVNKLVIK